MAASIFPTRRLGVAHRRILYGLAALVWVSGVGWLAAHYLSRPADSDPALPGPLEPAWLRIHGAAAMGFLVVFGSILNGHVLPSGWRMPSNRGLGLTLLGACVLLILGGYGLYYLADERLRPLLSASHWILGLAFGGVLILHAVRGQRLRSKP